MYISDCYYLLDYQFTIIIDLLNFVYNYLVEHTIHFFRRLVINEKNIPMTCAWMTSYASQKGAEKDNWTTAYEISTKEFEERFDVTFEDAPITFKLMLAINSNKN